MDFYFTDRDFSLLGTASTAMARDGGLDNSGIYITSDTDDQFATPAVGRSYTATLVFGEADVQKVKTMAAEGNFLLYKDYQGQSLFMTIMEWTEFEPHSGVLSFVAENGGVDLINETIDAYTATKAMGIADYISLFTADSGFEIGTNEIADLSRTLSWTGADDTALARIESVATQFDAELDFRFEVTGTAVVKRYIDIYKRIGADKGQRLEVNTHLNSIKTTGNIYDLYTSVVARGDTAEGTDKPITLAGYKYTDPTGRYVLTDGGLLMDTVANQTWSRLRSGGKQATVKGAYINRVKTYTAKSQAELFQSAMTDLKQAVQPVANYEADVAVLPDGVQVGDTVHLVDELQGLNLSTRLLELKTSYSASTRVATFGDFLIEESQIDPALQKMADDMKAAVKQTVQYYPWTMYADDDKGTGLAALPAGKAYMATVWSSKTSVPSTDPADYAGKWVLIKGTDGKPGTNGKDGNGVKSTAITYAASASGTDAPTTGWTATPPAATPGQYVWSRTVLTYTDGKTSTAYGVGKIGTDGKDGKDGKDITSYASGQVLPTAPGAKNSQFWLTDSTGTVTAFYKSDGTKWVTQPISASAINAATFNGLTFNGVIFNGSQFISTFKSAPVDESDFADITDPTGQTMLTKGTGTTKMGDGYLTVDGTIDGSSGSSLQTFHTEVGPAGLLSRLYTGGTAESNITAASQLYLGQLLLSNLDTSGKRVSGSLNGEIASQIDKIGTLAWSGVLYPQSGDTATMSIPLSQTQTGWLVRWSYYKNSKIQNIYYNYTLLPKVAVDVQNKNMFVTLSMPGVGTFFKILWYSDTDIAGESRNNQGTQAPYAVMDAVYAV